MDGTRDDKVSSTMDGTRDENVSSTMEVKENVRKEGSVEKPEI
jgi:hypothetical protein